MNVNIHFSERYRAWKPLRNPARGGEGSILGVVIGAAVLRLLYNAINILGIPTQLEFAIIGAVILIGVIADEFVRRLTATRISSEN